MPVSVRGSMVLQGPRPQEQILHLAGELGRVSPIMREEDSSRRARHERQTQREAETGGSFKLRACVHEVHLCRRQGLSQQEQPQGPRESPIQSYCLILEPIFRGRATFSRDREHVYVQEHANRAGKDCQDKAARRLTFLCVATQGRMRLFGTMSKVRRQSWSIYLHEDRRHARMLKIPYSWLIVFSMVGFLGIKEARAAFGAGGFAVPLLVAVPLLSTAFLRYHSNSGMIAPRAR